jgi:hypothetical protein
MRSDTTGVEAVDRAALAYNKATRMRGGARDLSLPPDAGRLNAGYRR